MSDSTPHSRALADALSCDHKWKMNTRAETECTECGTVERWEGGMLCETTHPALTGLEEQLEAAMGMLREVNAILDVGNDYDSSLLGDVFDWWQAEDGPRELLDEGFRTRQQSLRASSPASRPS